MEQRNWEARCCVLYRQPRGCAFSLRKVHTGKAAPVRKGISPQNHDESKLFVSLTVMTGVSHNCIILKITTQHQYLSRPPHGSTSSRLGGLQSNKSKASVLHGPISLSTTGLAIGDSTSFGGSILSITVTYYILVTTQARCSVNRWLPQEIQARNASDNFCARAVPFGTSQ